MTCNVTGTAISPNGLIKPGAKIMLRRAQLDVVSQEGSFVIPDDYIIQTASDGTVDFDILPGVYDATTVAVGGRTVAFRVSVPDEPAADFADLLNASYVEIPPASVTQAINARDAAIAAQNAAELARDEAVRQVSPYASLAELEASIISADVTLVRVIESDGVTVTDYTRSSSPIGADGVSNGGAVGWNRSRLNRAESVARQAINPGGFGGKFLSAKSAYRLELDHPENSELAPKFNISITSNVEGGHLNGPSDTRAGMWMMVQKNNPRTSLKSGEIDGLYMAVDQGCKDDAGGIILDAKKTFGSAEDTGGLTPIEISSSRVDPSNNTLERVQCIVGFQEGLGGFNEGKGVGFYTEARAGVPKAAFAGVGRPDLSGSPQFGYLIIGASSRTPSSAYYSVDNTGRSRGGNGTAASPAIGFISDPDTGVYRYGDNTIGFSVGGVGVAQLAGNAFAPIANMGISLGIAALRFSSVNTGEINIGTDATNGRRIFSSNGSPEGVHAASVGSLYLRRDGGAGTTLYVKESGTGSTGWVAK